jgi:hypothetical protein
MRGLVKLGQAFGGIDFGSWRFGWTAWAVDTHGIVTRVAELFSQREEAAVRARRIHDACERLGIVKATHLVVNKFPIWGDNANPSDITEMNAAWKRGWRDDVTGRDVVSPLRVIGVGMAEKMRRASVTRINDKLGAKVLRFARNVGAADRWLLGYNVGNSGQEMPGSRLMWEINHWTYPVPAEGKVDLKQDPDDHSADGADMVASMRYALMSWWRPGKEEDTEDLSAFDPRVLAAEAERTRTLRHRLNKRKSAITYDDGGF